jgi:hypothetical protein
MYKEFGPLILKISGSNKDKIKFKKELEDLNKKVFGPEIYKFLREFLFYKNIKGDSKQAWDTFYSRNAGIITKAIMDRADKNKINLSDKETLVIVEKLKTGKQGISVTLNAKVAEEAMKAFVDGKLDIETIMKRVMKFDNSTVKKISEDATKSLKEKGNF